MSRITGNDAKALMEAYAAVYAPQELTEEQIWEEVEAWVNSLLEEGYDLSEYTWEEMYEAYLNEAPMTAFQAGGGSAALAASSQRRNVRGGGTAMVPTKTRAQIETQGQQNLYKAGGGDAAIRASAQNRNVRGGGTRQVPTLSRQDIINRGSAAAGSTPKPATPAPAPRPAAAPARPASPTPSQSKVSPTQATTPRPGTKAAGPESIKPKTPNPLLAGGEIRRMQQASQMRQKGINVTSDQLASAERTKPATPSKATAAAPSTSPTTSGSVAPATAKLAATPKPTPVSPVRTPRERALNQSYEYDAYDIILEYLFSQGHVETLEEALYVMMEMDVETIGTIVEAAKDQSDTQIEKGVKTTYKAGNVLDNTHQGRSPGLNKLPADKRKAKTERMRGRLKTRRDDLFGERNRREDAKRAELKKLLGL